jgi:hypothetical protein
LGSVQTTLCSFYRTNGFSACCLILSILDFSVSLSDVCYPDWHTFGVPEIRLIHLSMKKPLFFRDFL